MYKKVKRRMRRKCVEIINLVWKLLYRFANINLKERRVIGDTFSLIFWYGIHVSMNGLSAHEINNKDNLNSHYYEKICFIFRFHFCVCNNSRGGAFFPVFMHIIALPLMFFLILFCITKVSENWHGKILSNKKLLRNLKYH